MDAHDIAEAGFSRTEKESKELVGQDVRRTDELQFDLYKHLTTLSAGTIVILAAFLNGAAGDLPKEGRGFLVASAVAMIIAVIIGYCGMTVAIWMRRSASAIMHSMFATSRDLKKNSTSPGPTDTSDVVAGHVEGMQSAGTQLEWAIRLNRILMWVGLVVLVVALVMLALFIWKMAR